MTQEIALFPNVSFGTDRVREAYGSRRPFDIQAVSVITSSYGMEEEFSRKLVDPEVKKHGLGYFMEAEAFDDGVFARCGFAEVAPGTIYKSTVNGVRSKNCSAASQKLLMLDCQNAALSKKLREDHWNNALQFVLRAHRFYLCVNKTTAEKHLYVPRYDIDTEAYIGFAELCDPNGKPVFTCTPKEYLGEGWDIAVWWAFLTSPSGQRKNTLLCLRGDENILKMTSIIEDITDAMTYGAWSVLKAAYGEKKLTFNKMCKLLSRPTLPMTGSVEYGEIKVLALYTGDFDYNGVAYMDGMGIMCALVFQRHYKAKYGFEIPLEELIGTCPQGRSACIKGLHPLVSPKAMRINILAQSEFKDIILYAKKDVTFELSVKLQKGGADVDGKVHIFGLDIAKTTTADQLPKEELYKLLEQVDFFGDSCVNKVMPDLSRLI